MANFASVPIRRRNRGRKRYSLNRRGSVLLLTALAIIPLLAMVAFAVDWGRICLTKAELQRAADAAAMAGAWELRDAKSPTSAFSPAAAATEARRAAVEYAAMNTAFGKSLNLQELDIEVGHLTNPVLPGIELDTSDPELFNVVRVRVRRDADSNGAIPMFFARILGKDDADSEASATAAFISSVSGFKVPLTENGEDTAPILPFALDAETWESAVHGVGTDEWKWDANADTFVFGSDGISEFNLYPQDTGSTANRGTVNIGTRSNSTSP